jgi:hypothetical protein
LLFRQAKIDLTKWQRKQLPTAQPLKVQILFPFFLLNFPENVKEKEKERTYVELTGDGVLLVRRRKNHSAGI